jgi:RHS repeat-associated protein
VSGTASSERPIFDDDKRDQRLGAAKAGIRLRDGQTISYAYDGLGRLKTRDRPNNIYWETDQDYGYDLIGHLTSASDSNGRTLGFGYDALGRRTNQSDNWYGWGNASYQYDAAGERTRMTWNDGNYVSYDYLTTGAMNTIRDSGSNVLVTFDYDDLSQRTSLTRANGTSTSYSYDPASRLSKLTLSGGNQPNSIRFGDSAAGQPGYNPAGQIINRSASNGAYAWTGAYNVNRSYGVNGLNQLTSAGSTNLGYDGRGNLTTSGSSSYGYTVDNQLATAPGANLAYDPVGRLFNINAENGINTTLTYDGADVIAEVNQSNGNLLRRYVYGPGSDEPLIWYEGAGFGDRRWLHADERGSVVAVTNDAGNTIAVNIYDEFGIPGGNNLGRFQYTGQKWLPSLGLYDYKARMYSPTLGRFMQTDPIGYDAGLNWYNYVGADPVNTTDPSGLDPAPEASCGINEVWDSVLKSCMVVVNGRRDRPSSTPLPQTYSFPSSGVMPRPGSPQSLQRNGQKPPSHDEGDPDYNRDLNKCRALADAGNRAAASRCYSSAEARKGLRDGGTPESQLPPLITWKNAAGVAGGVAVGTILYWVISEGSRILFPPRNLIPVP